MVGVVLPRSPGCKGFPDPWLGMGSWRHGDAVPPVDLASLAAAANRPGARWRLDGEDLQANLVWLGRGDRIEPHRNDEVDVLVVVISGRGELSLDGTAAGPAGRATLRFPGVVPRLPGCLR
jgi:quercetin dioxygenase-like cupin family protein